MKLKKLIENYNPTNLYSIKPFIIAEAGVNHEGNMDIAKRLINEAKEGGADAIKFQTYKAEKIASKDSPSYWDLSKEPTDSQYKLFKKYDKFWKNEFETLKTYCDEIDIEFLSTPFDVESAAFLNDLMDVFKISSSDLNNKPFVEILCCYNKPILLSTGAAYMWEIEECVGWIMKNGNPLALLHCVLNYPTDDYNANLSLITMLKRKFPEYMVGYSDHTLPKEMKILEIAALLGAQIIEKHFTHDKTIPGNDHYHAMDKNDLKKFLLRMEETEKILGNSLKEPLESEKISRLNARRSLVAARFIPKGKIIERDDITWKRPANGINPRMYESILGRKVVTNIQEDTIILYKMLGK